MSNIKEASRQIAEAYRLAREIIDRSCIDLHPGEKTNQQAAAVLAAAIISRTNAMDDEDLRREGL